jgi:hypothetical protein
VGWIKRDVCWAAQGHVVYLCLCARVQLHKHHNAFSSHSACLLNRHQSAQDYMWNVHRITCGMCIHTNMHYTRTNALTKSHPHTNT